MGPASRPPIWHSETEVRLTRQQVDAKGARLRLRDFDAHAAAKKRMLARRQPLVAIANQLLPGMPHGERDEFTIERITRGLTLLAAGDLDPTGMVDSIAIIKTIKWIESRKQIDEALRIMEQLYARGTTNTDVFYR